MNHRSKIVQDGLVLHLDAALSNSYSGSGNKWYDLTTNHYDASFMVYTEALTSTQILQNYYAMRPRF